MTIFEYYGAGADYVGHKVAEALGLPFHQQAFSSEVVEGRSGFRHGAVLAQVFSVLGGAYGGFDGCDVATTQRQKMETLLMDNWSQVWQYADEGGVILGCNGAATRPTPTTPSTSPTPGRSRIGKHRAATNFSGSPSIRQPSAR